MLKKKLYIAAVGILAFAMSGCVSYTEDSETVPEPVVSSEKEDEYRALLEETFNDFYWNYDEESIEFFEAEVPQNSDDFGKSALSSSEEAGYKLSRYSGDTLVCAAVNLLFYNGNAAGCAYAYINNGKIAGVYYVPNMDKTKAYSLNDRNVLSSSAAFTAYESDAPMAEFEERSIGSLSALKNGFSSEGDNGYEFMTAVIEDEKATVYTAKGKMPLEFEEGLLVLDCAVSSKDDVYNGIAVVLGRQGYSGEGGSHTIISEKVVYLDRNGNYVSTITEGKGASFVGFDGEYIVISQNGFIDFYKGTTKEIGIYTGIEVTDIKKCDFDGDGRYEYVLTDGNDIFVCRLENHTFSLLWRTNISSAFFDGDIYVGDLNGDGVSEIYLADSSGYGIRYTLTEKGFKYDTVGEGGECRYVCDFNLDGKSDYIETYADENASAKLFIAK